MGKVPVSSLQSAFDRAFTDHDGNFPLTAFEIRDAYTKFASEETNRIAKERMMALAGDMAANTHRHQECPVCHDTGFRYVNDPQGSNYRGVVRSECCNYWTRRAAKLAESAMTKI